MTRALVVGAGLAGLSAAYRLAKRGLQVMLVDKRARVGGVISSAYKEGFWFEEGPNSLRATPMVRQLLDGLDLEDATLETLATSKERAIWRQGKRHTLNGPKDLLKGELLSTAAKRHLLSEVLKPARAVKPGESVGYFLRERLGDEAMTALVEPVFTGVFAASPNEVGFEAWPALAGIAEKGCVLRALPGQMKMSRAPTLNFQKGLGQLISALEAKLLALGAEIKTETELSQLQPTATGYRASTTSGTCLEAEKVVLAVPAFVAASLLGAWLPKAHQHWLEALPYASAAAVSLGVPEAAFDGAPPKGFGTLIAPDSPLGSVLGLVFASNVFLERAPEGMVTVTAIMGGTRFPQALEATDAELIAQATKALAQMFPFKGEVAQAYVARHPKGIALLAPHHRTTFKTLLTHVPKGMALAGAWTLGAALPEVLRSGFEAADSVYR